MRMLKKYASKVLGVLPDDGAAVKQTARGLLMKTNLAAIKMAGAFRDERLPDPRTVFWLDPLRIERRTSLQNGSADAEDWVFPQIGNVKRVQPGTWDQSNIFVKDLRICLAVEERVRHGTAWDQSEYYKTALAQIRAGRELWSCPDRVALDKRMIELDRLIESIVEEGYRQNIAASRNCKVDSPLGHTEVLVNVGRNGEPLFQDGRHRLAIARTLGIKNIPVQVYVRHAEWQQFRQFMQHMAAGSGGASKPGFLYQKPQHFDLSDLPAEHGCDDRWAAISQHLPEHRGLALDIGANLGYFSHELDRAGFSTMAVEYLPEAVLAAKRIALAEKRDIKVIQGDILAPSIFETIGTSQFDVVLAINIFHHFIKSEEGFLRLQTFMRRLRSKIMFFEPHHPDDPQMHGGYSNPTPESFARMIADWGDFNDFESIFSAHDGRSIFKLTRGRG